MEREKARQELEALLDDIKEPTEKKKARQELETLMKSMTPVQTKRHQKSIGNGRGIDDKLKNCTEKKMTWIRAGGFLVQPTKDGIPVITIHSLQDSPLKAFIIYNGGNRALFFRTPKVGIVLEHINPGIRKWLSSANEAGICEIDPITNNMAPIYRVPLLHVSPTINMNLYKK